MDDDISKGALWMEECGRMGLKKRSSWKRKFCCVLLIELNFLV